MGGYGWGDVQEQELIDAVHTALDSGVNFFDTAETYGLGQSERTLGKALGARRKDVVISDKFGVHAKKGQPTFYDNSREYIFEACEGSLQRLGTDYIDLYTVHYRDGKTPLADVADTLERLKEQGKIRYAALSNIGEADEAELKALKGKFVSFQDEYSLACRKNEAVIKRLAKEYDLSPLTWGSLGQGILTGKYNLENTNFGADDRRSREIYVNFHGEKLKKNLEIVETMRTIAATHAVSVASVAVRYILDNIEESVVLAGIKRPAQLKSNLEAFNFNLSEEELQVLNEISK
ncbi:MAG: aldo/keto reductase [Clostridia bacterium]|nr:aldo/keto reductase [Clostridia bacterium]